MQVKRLVHLFCGLYNLPLPADLDNFDDVSSDQQNDDAIVENDYPENVEEDDSEDETLDEFDFDAEMEDKPVRQIYFD